MNTIRVDAPCPEECEAMGTAYTYVGCGNSCDNVSCLHRFYPSEQICAGCEPGCFCSPGYFMNPDNECVSSDSCPAEAYCEPGQYLQGPSGCSECPENHVITGPANNLSCEVCSFNQYSGAGSTQCETLSCDIGRFASNHECEACPEGQTTVNIGAVSLNQCEFVSLSCNPGYFMNLEETACTECPANSWSDSSDFKMREWPVWPTDFKWSHSGPLEGYFCLEWTEPLDANWNDNFLCWPEQFGDIGFDWFSSGISVGISAVDSHYQDYKMCDWINEYDFNGWMPRRKKRNTQGLSLDNSDAGNYLCVPRNSPYKFHWNPSSDSRRGPDGFYYGTSATYCLKIDDPVKPSTDWWRDNYLCAKPTTVVEHACIPCENNSISDAGSTSKGACVSP